MSLHGGGGTLCEGFKLETMEWRELWVRGWVRKVLEVSAVGEDQSFLNFMKSGTVFCEPNYLQSLTPLNDERVNE